LDFFSREKDISNGEKAAGQDGKVLDEDNLKKLLKLLLTFVAIK
jgi:hypothetical protein